MKDKTWMIERIVDQAKNDLLDFAKQHEIVICQEKQYLIKDAVRRACEDAYALALKLTDQQKDQ